MEVLYPDFSAIKILVVGDVMLDRYWIGEVNRISPEAPIPIARIQQETDRLGGAANVAMNIRSLGGRVSLLGVVGRDNAGKDLCSTLEKYDIHDCLCVDQYCPTILKLRVLGQQQQMLRIDFESKPDDAVLDVLYRKFLDLVSAYDVIVFSDYAKGALKDVSKMITKARELGKIVLVDPKGVDFERYKGASVLTPNKAELGAVVGEWHDEDDLRRKAQQVVRNLGLQYLLLTRSEEGMSLYQEHDVIHAPAKAKEVADVTGAGDAVIATLALMLSGNYTIELAVDYANRAGSIVVEKLGTTVLAYQELFPTL